MLSISQCIRVLEKYSDGSVEDLLKDERQVEYVRDTLYMFAETLVEKYLEGANDE